MQVGATVQMLIPLAGNLGRVDFINDYEYDLFVRPDTCNPRYRYLLVRLPCPGVTQYGGCQVLVQLLGGECRPRPEDHLQHREPEQDEEPLHHRPHPHRALHLAAQVAAHPPDLRLLLQGDL